MKRFSVLLCLTTLSLWVQASDTSFSLAGTTPVNQFERAGARLYIQENVGRHLTLGAGYAQSEPQLGVSQGSFIARFTLPFQTGINERIYPMMGVDQRIEAQVIEPAMYFGVGIEQQWIDQWGGFLEARYQLEREQDWHLQAGIRFWPGRAKQLDVRMRKSEPDTARDNPVPEPRIELEPVEPAPEPVKPPVQPEQHLSNLMDQAKRDLPDGVYVHLGFFRLVHSIQRYRHLVTDYVWGDELLVHYDERLKGFRVLIGPYTEADARARRRDIREHGMDAFIYWVPERP